MVMMTGSWSCPVVVALRKEPVRVQDRKKNTRKHNRHHNQQEDECSGDMQCEAEGGPYTSHVKQHLKSFENSSAITCPALA